MEDTIKNPKVFALTKLIGRTVDVKHVAVYKAGNPIVNIEWVSVVGFELGKIGATPHTRPCWTMVVVDKNGTPTKIRSDLIEEVKVYA
jgi:hypothetical protein